jgi:predicted AAA+ superfamily ATPase
MWIERYIAKELKSLSQTFPIIVLTGPRQVGKTSLFEKYFSDYNYVSLDYAGFSESAETRPGEFLDQYKPPVVIDEIQYAPSLLRHIKNRVDQTKSKKGLYFLTGSQSFPLMKSVSESLAGRAVIIPFLGLSFNEWENCAELKKAFNYNDFLWLGGFPGLWSDLNHLPDRNRWYQSYIATYLERDVRNVLNVGKLRDFERFLRACAMRTGQILNMSELGRDIGISPTTAREWISVMQALNQILLLEPYYRSLGKRLIKSPKLYFTDTGLALFLAGYESFDSLFSSPKYGAYWENHVIGQWLRWRDWTSSAAGLWFWQDRTKNEVDLVIEVNQKLYPVECKRKENPDKKDIIGILKFIDMYGEKNIGRAYIACNTESRYDITKSITAIAGWKVWDLE